MKHCKMFGFFCILKTQYMSPWIRVISALSGSISSPAVISIIYWKNVCSILEINAYERTIYSIVNTWFKKKKNLTDFCLHIHYTHFECCWPCWYLETLMHAQLLLVILFLHGTAVFHYLLLFYCLLRQRKK